MFCLAIFPSIWTSPEGQNGSIPYTPTLFAYEDNDFIQFEDDDLFALEEI